MYSLYFHRIYDMTRIHSVNKTTLLIPVLESLLSCVSCCNYLSEHLLPHFFTVLPFPVLLGSGCCRESSQTSGSGERRDGRRTCKRYFWKVGIDWITHKAVNMLLNIAWLPREVMFFSQQPSGLDNTTRTHMTGFIETPSSLFFMNYWQFIIVSDTFNSSKP